MLKRAIVGAAALVVVGALGYVIWLNPSAVDFQFIRNQTLRLPLGWLLIFAFAAGAAVTGATMLAQQLMVRLGSWRQRRRDRVADRIASWEQAGSALAWEGELERARSLLLKAWRRAPRNHGAALALASSYMDTGEFDHARKVLEEAVTHDASDADVRVALSEALRRTGQLNEAIRMLETVRVQHPRAPRVLLALRELYRDARRWDEAAQLQEAYLNSLPYERRNGSERQRLLDLRCQGLTERQDLTTRIDGLRALVATDRSYVPAIAALAEALAASGDGQAAARLLERSVRQIPCLLLIERLLQLQTQPRERQRLLASLRKLPGIGEDALHYLAARTALDDGNFDGAAAELDKIKSREHPALTRLWADVHRQRGSVREALRAYTQLADGDPQRFGGYPCSLCERIPRSPGSRIPTCKYWDGIRSLSSVE